MLNLEAQHFGLWKVLKRAPNKQCLSRTMQYWLCECVCGVQKEVAQSALRRGLSTGCGCARKSWDKYADAQQCQINRVILKYKQNAVRRHILWDLTYAQTVELFNSKCHYCGCVGSNVQSIARDRKWGEPFRYNGIDRLNSTLGYTVTNCVSSCKTHNQMKWDMSESKFLAECRRVVEFTSQTMVASQ